MNWRSTAKITIPSLVLLLFVTMAASALAAGNDIQQLPDKSNIGYWQLQDTQALLWNIDQTVTIQQKAEHTFWALQFSFAESPEVGYMGLQTDGNMFNGTTSEIAIFSIWGATAADGPACSTFEENGSGYSCRINFKIETDHPYRYRLWRLNEDTEGQRWGAWIIEDGGRGMEHYIGQIRLPVAGHKFLSVANGLINFVEYFGTSQPCKVVSSLATFEAPAGNYHGGNSNVYDFYSSADVPVPPSGTDNSPQGNCPNLPDPLPDETTM